MADEVLDCTDVVFQLFGKRKRLSDQPRNSLSQGAVESLNMIGDAPLLVDDPMLLFGNHTHIGTPTIGIEPGMLAVEFGY